MAEKLRQLDSATICGVSHSWPQQEIIDPWSGYGEAALAIMKLYVPALARLAPAKKHPFAMRNLIMVFSCTDFHAILGTC